VPDDALPDSFAGQRWTYRATQLVPLLVFLGIGVVFVLVGRWENQESGRAAPGAAARTVRG